MEKETKETKTTVETIKTNGSDGQKTNDEKVKEIVQKVSPYIKRLWENRWRIVLINFAVAVITVLVLVFFVKPYYESTVTILPEYGSKSTMLGQLSSLAAMAGVNVGDSAPTEIYQNILKSETVIRPVVFAKYQTEEFSDSVNLIQYFEIEPDRQLEKNLQTRKMFLSLYSMLTKSKINTDVDRITKILTVSIKMPESKLSADVANNLVSSLDQYVRTQRKSYSTEQRYYIEKRVKQILDSLTISEEKLKRFSEQNRIVNHSPQLMLEQDRLMRQVEILQTVYTELTKQLEIAKIDEIKDAPVINIKEKASEPILKAGPQKAFIFIILMFFSTILSIIYILFKDQFKYYFSLLREK